MPTIASSPRWDLTPFFSSVDSPEFAEALRDLEKSIGDLEDSILELELGPGAGPEAFGETFASYSEVLESLHSLRGYVELLVSTDSNDAFAQARESELDVLTSRFREIESRLTGWIGSLDIERLMRESPLARDHEFSLKRAAVLASKLMSPAEEALAAKLSPVGSIAWAKLHGNVTSQIEVRVNLPTGEETLPMSAVRNLASDADRAVRMAAYDAELEAWKQYEVPCAAAINSIKGEVSLLCRLRGWRSALDRSLFEANIDAGALESMLAAAKESFPDFQRYLRAKASVLGLKKLAWFDLFAPVGNSEEDWSYEEAAVFVERQFRRYSDKMGDFAARNFSENWIDAEPRPGKRDGAFCQSVRPGISRIMMNFKPSFGSVSTLAHELGHGYHNLCLAARTPIQRDTPMTLAETASIFCETLLKKAALAEKGASDNLSILEASLQGSCQVVVDITSRFFFESGLFEGRAEREFSPGELCDLMLKAQRQTYGEGLDEELLHPYMWAVKPHYYSTDSFYNYPYMFGLLFALGLFAIYEREPEAFKDRYDLLLSQTGLFDAATLAARFGIDIRSIEFWRGSLGIIREDIDRFEAIAGSR